MIFNVISELAKPVSKKMFTRHTLQADEAERMCYKGNFRQGAHAEDIGGLY